MDRRSQFVIRKMFVGAALGLVVCAAVGCGRPAADLSAQIETAATQAPVQTPAAPAATAVATPDPAIPQAPPITAEGPLSGGAPDIPEIWIVPSSVSKTSLAEFLKTTVDQLDWANPGLSDLVVPGTLVVIPPVYHLSSTESIATIADATGLSPDAIQAANPKLAATSVLTEGTVLALPAVVVMPDNSTLTSAAAALNLSVDDLLSANPELAGHNTVDAGTVLVVPPAGVATETP